MGPTPKPERMNAYLEVSGGKTAHIEPVRKTSQGRAYQIVFKNSQLLVCDGKKSKSKFGPYLFVKGIKYNI